MALTIEAALRKDKRNAKCIPARMEHRHFAMIAGILALLPQSEENDEIVEHFAKELAKTNPRFDRARFLRAAASKGS